MIRLILITCDAMVEPFALKDVPNAIGVQLNFELQTETGDSEADTAAKDREEFRTFLKELPSTRFFAYKKNETKLETKLDAPKELTPILQASDTHVDAIINWLEEQLKANGATWHHADPEDGEATVYSDLSAGQFLAGAQTWPSPLPQGPGLNRLLESPDALPLDDYIVAIPWLEAGKDAPAELEIKESLTDTESLRVVGPGWPDYLLVQVNKLSEITDETGVKDGFLEVAKYDDDVITIVEALRRKAAGLFWTAPQLIALAPTIPEAPSNGADDEQRRKDALKRLQLRAKHTVSTMLDTLLLTLAMPWEKGAGEAHFVLGPIVQCVIAAAEEMEDVGEISEGYGLCLATYPGLVREWVEDLRDKWPGYLTALSKLLGRTNFEDEYKSKEWDKLTPAEHLANGHSILAWLLLQEDAASRDPGETFDFVAADAQLDQELAEMVQQLGEEQGFEAAVLEFLRSAKGSGGQLLLDELFVANRAPAAGTTAEAQPNSNKAAFSTKLITKIEAYLAGRANALEWARQAVGRLCAKAYLDAVQIAQAKNPPEQPPSLNDYNWFAERTGEHPLIEREQLFDHLLLILPYPNAALESADKEILDEAWIETYGDLCVGLEGSQRRFVPDTHPADLPVALPLPPQRQEADTFEPLYDGVGMLVRSKKGRRCGQVVTCQSGEAQTHRQYGIRQPDNALATSLRRWRAQPVLPLSRLPLGFRNA